MEFEAISIRRYGRLREWETEDHTGGAPLGSLVVVHGGNEAGKTTLFDFLTTILYGFRPANQEAHPYRPWEGGEIEGRARLRTSADECWEVSRRLLSTPRGELVEGDRRLDLRNHPLELVSHIPRDLFRSVFALRLKDVARLDPSTWDRVGDRLLGGLGAEDILPLREVWLALEKEATTFWRPDGRGKPRVRELRKRLQGLREDREAARERDAAVRRADRDRAGVRQELSRLREELARLEREKERIDRLVPVRERLRRIEALLERAGPIEELGDLPSDPGGRRTELSNAEARLRTELDRIETRGAKLGETIAAFGDEDAAVVDRAPSIERLTGRRDWITQTGQEIGRLDPEVRERERELTDASRELFGLPWSEVDPVVVQDLPLIEIGEAVRAFADAEARESRLAAVAETSTASEGPNAPSPIVRWAPVLVLALVGAGLGTAGLLAPSAPIGVAGLVVVVAAAALALVSRRGGRTMEGRRAVTGQKAEEDLREARAELATARDRLRALVEPLPLLERWTSRPEPGFPAELRRFGDLLAGRAERAERLETLETELAAALGELERVATECGLEGVADPQDALTRLATRLRAARAREAAAKTASEELGPLEERRTEIETELAGVAHARGALEERLREAGEGDPERGAALLAERIEAAEKAATIREDLEETHPDLDLLEERIAEADAAGEEWTRDEESAARTTARIGELHREIEELSREEQTLTDLIERPPPGRSGAEVEGEIAMVRDEIEEAEYEHDRRVVFARVLREADRRFREEHQPDVLRRAARHLALVTGGRYDRILADEGEERFHLRADEASEALPLDSPLSTGTLEQAYLALRLAVVDHLDRGGERLPVFFDEIFVNWDAERRERGFDLLREIARERQVFVLTCHEPFAEELVGRGARLLRLEGPG